MKFDVSGPVIPASNTPEKRIVCVAWAPDGERLALATADRFVSLVRAGTNQVSKFPVKARDENANRAFTITGLAWAPDSCRFAVSQSDMAVAVYDVGPASVADARKKITLRFTHKSPVLCVAWPVSSSSDFVYGMGDGAVHCGLTKLKKSEELYRHGCAPVSITAAARMNSVAVGHLDGNVFIVNLDTRSRLIALQTAVPPLALAWGQQICAAGSDLQVNFADANGSSSSHVDYSNQQGLRSFTAAAFDPSGSTAIVAGRNTLMTFSYSGKMQAWQEQAKLEFDGVYAVPDLAWSPDGSKIAVCSVTGGLYIVTVSIGGFRYKDLFEVVYVSGSQVKVINLKTSKEMSLKSDFRVLTTNFYQDRYIVARTTQSFVVGDTVSGKICELGASLADGEPKINERFAFIDDVAVLVWNSGELTVLEFGKLQPLASISTQYPSQYLLSLRFGAKIGKGNSKILAYLMDSKTVKVVDCETLMAVGTVQVPNKIDWLELNVSGTMLLFRDAKRSLYVYNLITHQLNGLLSACSYAQWVPEANVIVAQSKKSLYVWYSPNSPDDVKVREIEGDVVDIARKGTKTAVSISMNGKISPLALDGAFIAFSAAMEGGNLSDAAQILLEMPSGSDYKALWGELASAAMMASDFPIAEVSYSNLCDLPRAKFLHKLNKLISAHGMGNSLVQARIAMLQSNFKQAEYCLIEHDQLDAALDMYRSMHMWNELLDLAELRCPSKAQQIRDEYFQHLLDSGQYQVAARLKSRRGDISEAVDLCLQGEKPQLAADILLNSGDNVNPQLLAHVAEALVKKNRFDIAGQVYEKLGKPTEALESYRKGHSYYRALELAKAASPDSVIAIEKEWADYLVSQGQNDAATMHYVESGDYALALNCSLRAQQWQQAAEILRSAASTSDLVKQLRVQYLRVGRHFAGTGDTATAEDLFLTVDATKELVEMYLNLGRIDEAVRRAKRQMKPNEMEQLFIDTAQKLSKRAQTRTIAEQIYLAINKSELAMDMYRSAGDTASLLRLTSQYGGDKGQLESMAVQAERQGDLETAESCYIRAGSWEKARFMYEQEKKWQDALRVAKEHGTQAAEMSVAAHWAIDIGGSAGVQKLVQIKLVEPVLLYACENSMSDLVNLIMTNCKTLSKTTVHQAHMKFAQALEAQSKFADAEQQYCAANQPREAVEMYTHNKMWTDAQRVAHKYGITDLPVTPSKAQSHATSTISGAGLQRAIQLDQAGQYDAAIDAYLALSVADCGGEEQLDQVMDRAVKLTLTYRQGRLQDCVNTVAQILLDLQRHASLGKILESIEAYTDAFEIYRAGGMWADAARLVSYVEPEEQAEFQREYQEHLAQNRNTSGLMNMGQVDAALAVYARNGDWDMCLKQAEKEGPEYVEKYTMMYAQELVQQHKFGEAITILARYSGGPTSTTVPAYLSLCQSSLYGLESSEVLTPTLTTLRLMRFKVLRNIQPSTPGYMPLQRFTRGVHLLCQRAACLKYGLNDQAARAALSSLRYADVIPADFVFCKAGEIMEKLGKVDTAITLYTTFCDLLAQAGTGTKVQVDHTKYDKTDIPTEFFLRPQLAVDAEVAKRVNDWVIEKTLDDEYTASLPTSPCLKCGRPIYAASLACPYCRTTFEFCSITGYPVSNPTRCTACGAMANRADWGAFTAAVGVCPCCSASQVAGA